MKIHIALGSVALLVLTFSAGCGSRRVDDRRNPLTPSQACVVDTVWRGGAPSDARIARAVPEYAGSYSDPPALTIFVTDLRAGERAHAALRSEIQSIWPQAVIPNASFVRVRFSYRQLQSWLECLTQRSQPSDGHGGEGWFRAGLNPPRNAVRIEVIGENARASLEQLITQLGIPREAVVLAVLRNEE